MTIMQHAFQKAGIQRKLVARAKRNSRKVVRIPTTTMMRITNTPHDISRLAVARVERKKIEHYVAQTAAVRKQALTG